MAHWGSSSAIRGPTVVGLPFRTAWAGTAKPACAPRSPSDELSSGQSARLRRDRPWSPEPLRVERIAQVRPTFRVHEGREGFISRWRGSGSGRTLQRVDAENAGLSLITILRSTPLRGRTGRGRRNVRCPKPFTVQRLTLSLHQPNADCHPVGHGLDAHYCLEGGDCG